MNSEDRVMKFLKKFLEKRGYGMSLERSVLVTSGTTFVYGGGEASVQSALFGSNDWYSLFDWINRVLNGRTGFPDGYGGTVQFRFCQDCSRLASLSGCSSAEEIEFRMKTTGITEE